MLAEKNGSDWCTTGRTMGKMSSECRNMFLKLTNKRVNTGHYSREEDAALLAAIRKARGFKRDHPVEDIPDKGNEHLVTPLDFSPLNYNDFFSLLDPLQSSQYLPPCKAILGRRLPDL